MGKKNRSGAPNKRPGSRCFHKMMSPKAAARRRRIYLYWQDRLARVEAARIESRERMKERRV